MMKSILSLLLLTFLIDIVEAQIDSSVKKSALIYSREKKGKQLNKRTRDKIIKSNLPGNWDWHDGIWQFEPDGKMQFFYTDTVRSAGTWKVKHGIIFSETTLPDRKFIWKNKVIYCTTDTIKFKRPESTNPDKIITMYRIKG